MDWISRLEGSIWENKPMFLLATSPGGRGGKSVLTLAANSYKFMNNNSLIPFSLPYFQKNFSEEQSIIDETLSNEFHKQLNQFSTSWIEH